MMFHLKRAGPTFDIETERDSFKEWKLQWEAYSFNSGLEDIGDEEDRKKHTLMALCEALSRKTLRTRVVLIYIQKIFFLKSAGLTLQNCSFW